MDAIALKEKKFNKLITLVSIVIPVVVAILFRVKLPNVEPLSFLPPIYAATNGLTALLLIVAVWAIKMVSASYTRM
jgi:putative membrane protein